MRTLVPLLAGVALVVAAAPPVASGAFAPDVETLSTPDASTSTPAVGVGPTGAAAVAWVRGGRVELRSRAAGSTTWSPTQDLGGAAGVVGLPKVVVAPDGTVTVLVLRSPGFSCLTVDACDVDASRAPAGGTFPFLGLLADTANATAFDAAALPDSSVLVAVADRLMGQDTVRHAVVPSGGTVLTNFPVVPSAVTSNPNAIGSVDVAVGPAGRAAVLWGQGGAASAGSAEPGTIRGALREPGGFSNATTLAQVAPPFVSPGDVGGSSSLSIPDVEAAWTAPVAALGPATTTQTLDTAAGATFVDFVNTGALRLVPDAGSGLDATWLRMSSITGSQSATARLATLPAAGGAFGAAVDVATGATTFGPSDDTRPRAAAPFRAVGGPLVVPFARPSTALLARTVEAGALGAETTLVGDPGGALAFSDGAVVGPASGSDGTGGALVATRVAPTTGDPRIVVATFRLPTPPAPPGPTDGGGTTPPPPAGGTTPPPAGDGATPPPVARAARVTLRAFPRRGVSLRGTKRRLRVGLAITAPGRLTLSLRRGTRTVATSTRTLRSTGPRTVVLRLPRRVRPGAHTLVATLRPTAGGPSRTARRAVRLRR